MRAGLVAIGVVCAFSVLSTVQAVPSSFSVDFDSPTASAEATNVDGGDILRSSGNLGIDFDGGTGPFIAIDGMRFGVGDGIELDALSQGDHYQPNSSPSDFMQLFFSVDRDSTGVFDPNANDYNVFHQAARGQAAGDIYRALPVFQSPHSDLAFESPVFGDTLGNELVAGQVGADLVPTIGSETYNIYPIDNIDAFEFTGFDIDADGDHDTDVYFSTSDPNNLHSSAIIWRTPPGSEEREEWFDLELPGRDVDVDALIVFDVHNHGEFDPGEDLVLFSLTPGSDFPDGTGPADIFWSDGGNWADGNGGGVLATATQLGLLNSDNVDALDFEPFTIPEPATVAVLILSLPITLCRRIR